MLVKGQELLTDELCWKSEKFEMHLLFQGSSCDASLCIYECEHRLQERLKERLQENSRATLLSLIVAVVVVLWWLPIPWGITQQAWHLFAIFVATMGELLSLCCPLIYRIRHIRPAHLLLEFYDSKRRDLLVLPVYAADTAAKSLRCRWCAAGIIAQPLPSGAVALIALGATVLTKTLPFSAAFAAFGNLPDMQKTCKAMESKHG